MNTYVVIERCTKYSRSLIIQKENIKKYIYVFYSKKKNKKKTTNMYIFWKLFIVRNTLISLKPVR